MKLGTQLLLAPLLTAVVAFGSGQAAVWLNARDAAANEVAYGHQIELFKTVSSVSDQLAAINTSVYRTIALVSSLPEDQINAARADIGKQLQGVQRTLAASGEEAGADDAVRQFVAQGVAATGQYGKQADQAIDLSAIDPNTGIAALRSADDSYKALSDAMTSLVNHVDEIRASGARSSAERQWRTSVLAGALGLLATTLAVGLAGRHQRRFVRDLQAAGRVADAVADGDLSARAPAASRERRDEVGHLLASIDRMAAQLGVSVGAVQQAARSIETSSSEIASGNNDLSHRTEQTASNLQQAASAMEELSSTVEQTAASSRSALEVAGEASEAAQRGGSVVTQVVQTMEQINVASRRIGDIIGVIDGIAFQTNILALNAAVEAARAGEQGRGFAVVASEVRSLAGRSADAAREIKSLIHASVEKVDAGSRLVGDAGTAMDDIVRNVQRVSQMIGEISTATGEQSRGIAQVTSAVGSLDQMTQQNAALVEQSAAAAVSLQQQGGHLAEAVARFRV